MSEKVPAKSTLSATELREALTHGSIALNEKATSLSTRLRRLEAFLAELPGRVDTTLWLSGWDGRHDVSLVLRFHRVGKAWRLSYDVVHDLAVDFEDGPDWEAVVDAPLEVKIEVVQRLPELLSKMLDAQAARIEDLDKAHQTLDRLAADFGVDAKGGK